MNPAWPLKFMPKHVGLLGILVTVCAIVLFLLSYRELRAGGTSVRGAPVPLRLCKTSPYRFSRTPIYVAFILFVLGLSICLNNLWMLVMLVPAIGIIATAVIRPEERFLERNFTDQYSSYKARVRRWL